MINNSYICNSNSIVEGCLFKRHLPNNSRRTSTLEATIRLSYYMKQIEGFENYYVDELGNVYSDKLGSLHKLTPIIRSGYACVRLSIQGRVYNKNIHRLLAQVFIPNPENKKTVNHKNGNKTDNRVENLEWCTQSENVKHAFRIGLKSSSKGERHGSSKLTDLQVILIRKDIRSQRKIAKEYMVCQSTIAAIKRGQLWKHIN